MCSKGIAKCFLIVFNAIFFLLGAALLAVGLFVLFQDSIDLSVFSKVSSNAEATIDQVLETTSLLQQSAYVLIAVGAFIFVIGFCGCCGALKGSTILLYVYAFLVFLVLAVQIAGAVLCVFYKELVDKHMKPFLNNTITDKYEGAIHINGSTVSLSSTEPVTVAWDSTMIYLQCCGLDSYTDMATYASNWNRTNYVTGLGYVDVAVPLSCCKMVDNTKFPDAIGDIQFTDINTCVQSGGAAATNQDGCYDKLYALLKKYSYYLLAVGIAFAVIEMLGIAAACILARAISKDD